MILIRNGENVYNSAGGVAYGSTMNPSLFGSGGGGSNGGSGGGFISIT